MGEIKFTGIKGLTANDRAQWEKDNINELNARGYNSLADKDKQDVFKSWAFKAKFGNRSDYNVIKNYTTEQKDSLYNSDKLDIAPIDTRTTDNKRVDSLKQAYNKDVTDYAANQENYKTYSNRYSKYPGSLNKDWEKFDKFAQEASPYFKKYAGSEYLPLDESTKVDLMSGYKADVGVYGQEEAAKRFANKVQTTVSKKQPLSDKLIYGVQGAGTTLVGSTIAGIGTILAAVASPINQVVNEGYDNDLNFFQNWGRDIMDNPFTRYGNKVMQQGHFLNLSDDTNASNPFEIVRTAEEVNGNLADNIFSVNTVPELVSQSGFTIGAMLQGAGLTTLGNRVFNTVKYATLSSKVGATVEQIDRINRQLQFISKLQKGFNAFAVPGAVGSIEGSIEGLNTKLTFLEDSKTQIAEQQQEAVDKAMQLFLSNPDEAKKLGFDLSTQYGVEQLQKYIFDSYQPIYEDALKKAERNADIAGLNNFVLNSGINGFANIMFKNAIFSPSVRGALERTKVGQLFKSDYFTIVDDKVTAKAVSKWKQGLDVFKEMFGEFGEEYSQSITDAFARGGAEVSLANYLEQRYNGVANDAINDSLADNLGGAFAAAGESAISKETILAGIYGAMSQAIGTPTINRRALQEADKSKSSKALGVLRTFYRNPIIEQIISQRNDANIQKQTAETINSWLEQDGNLDKYNSLAGSISWANEMFNSAKEGDEFSYRNNRTGKLVNDALMIQKLKGTELYNSIIENYLGVLNIEEGSEEAAKIEEDNGISLDVVKQNAQRMLDTFKSIQEASEDLDKSLGNSINPEVKQALIFGKINMKDWTERATQLEDELNKIEVTGNTEFSDEQKATIARLGSLDRYNIPKQQENINKLNKEIEVLSKNGAVLTDKQKESLKAKKKQLKQLSERLQLSEAAQKKFDKKDAVLSEVEIMSLLPQDRYKMLNPKNKDNYSAAQQAIIDNLIAKGTVTTSDFMNKVEDAARINKALEGHLVEYNYALSNPKYLDMIANYLKIQSYKENLNKKFDSLNKIDNIADFTQAIQEATKNSTNFETNMLYSKLKSNPLFKEYQEISKTFDGVITQLEENDDFKNVDKQVKDGVLMALSYLQDKGINPNTTNAISALLDNDGQAFSNYVNNKNAELDPKDRLDIPNITEIIDTYKSLFEAHTNNTKAVEAVTQPVEITSTTTEDSKPPKPVGVFEQIQKNPEMVADRDLKEENSSAPAKPGVFGAIQNNPDLARGVDTESTTATPTTDLVDKYKVNSNQEVANSVQKGLSIIDNSSSMYDEVKEQATQIIDELGDSEYESSADLSEAIMVKANQIQAQVEVGGDRNDKVSSLLKQVAAKMKVKSEVSTTTKVEEAKTQPIVNGDRRNNSMITTADVDKHPQSVVGQASKNFKMNDYLRKGHITPKTPIMFVADPAIIAGVKQEMGEAYNESDHLPIMAVVEDSNGPIIIGDKKYQPIGFMPRTSANSQGAARMEPVRLAGLTQQDGTLLKDKDGKVITTNGYVRANPPEHTKAGTPNTPIHTIMSNDMDSESRDKMNNDNLPIQERQSIYRKFKNSILSNIRRVAKDAKGERIHLAYFTSNMKGGEQEFELYVTTPQNSFSRTGKPMVQVLTEGNPEELLKANSRLNRYGKTLEEFFKKKPFSDDIRLKRDNGVLVPIGDGESKLKALGESLTKKLSNYITIPKGYEYVLIPTEEMIEGSRMYQLSLTNGTNTIPLAKVTNGTMTDETKSQVIKSLFLDNNNFRYEGTQPFAKWQVNYNDFDAKEGESDEARKIRLGNASDIFDDNILESSRTSLKYTIRGIDINSPFKQSASQTQSPTLVVANQDNATTSKPINTPVITANDQVKVGNAIVDSESGAVLQGEIKSTSNQTVDKARDIANRIIEDSKSIRLADDNSGQQAIESPEVQKEMDEIKKKAIVDGTFMKAPNGKKSNLTERQWLQVRTKAFKDWFGDWENDPEHSSKVVDENGEPLVVYHGTKNNIEINKIDLSKSDDSISFFTTNDEYHTANSYTESGINTGNSHLDEIVNGILEYEGTADYTKVKQHIEESIHNFEASLNDLGPFDDEVTLKESIHKNKELLQYLKDNKDTLDFNGSPANIYSFFNSLKNPLIIDVKGKNWNKIQFEGNTFSTREIAKIAKERGYDGVIFKNIRDLGAGMSYEGASFEGEVKQPNVYISFDPNQIESATGNVARTNDNYGYIDEEGRRYARVTSIIQADETAGERFDPNSPWITPSTNIGTSVDEFVRDFFAGEFTGEDGKLLNDYLYDYPNATQGDWRAFANQLVELKNHLDAKGLTIIPRDITVTGTIKVTDSQGQVHEVPVAGTLDLLAYDAQGNFHIFDMKTNRSGISEEKRKKYSKQVSMYQKFLEDKYGIKVASLNIIPINVSYPIPLGFRDGKIKYEVSEGNQLLANGKEFKNAEPILEEVGSVPYTDVNIQYDKLTDSEKQMITDMLPADVKVEKTEIVEPETVVNKNLGIKMSRVKNRFANPAKKSNLVTPSANNWELLSDDIRQSAIQLGYTKESWNNMTEEEKQHQKECLS